MRLPKVKTIALSFATGILLSASPSPSAAQQTPAVTGSISGIVTDAASRPVPGAIVSVTELRLQAVTGPDGRFGFSSVPAGHYTLVARRLGYASAVRSSIASQSTGVTMTLVSTPMTVDPITVTATREPAVVGGSVLAVSEVSEEALRRNATISLAHSLKSLPGVRSVSTGEQVGKPMLRGLFGSRVLVVQDGSRLEDYSWSEEDAPSVDARLAQRVEVIRGPASVLYGSDAIGGVVNVIPQDLPTTMDGRSFRHAGAEVYGASNNKEGGGALAFEGASGRIGWRAMGIARLAQSFETPDGEVENTGYFSVNGEAAAGIHGDRSNTTLRFSHYGGEFKLLEARKPEGALEAEEEEGPERKLADDRLQLTNDLLFSGVRLETKAQYQRHSLVEVSDDLCNIDPSSCAPTLGSSTGKKEQTAFDLLLNTGTVDVLAHHALSESLHGVAGVAGMFQKNDSRGPIFLIPSATTSSAAAFAFEEATAGIFTFAAGARVDARKTSADANPSIGLSSARELNYTEPSGNVGVVVRPIPFLSIIANAGAAWRAPTLFELFANGPHLAEARYEIGDPTLKTERAGNLDLGLRWGNEVVRAEVTGFRNAIDRYVYLTPIYATQGGLRVFKHLQADALLTGGEGAIQIAATPALLLRGWYDLVRGTNRDSGEPLPLMPPQRGAAGAEYRFTSGWAGHAFISGEVEHTMKQDRPNSLDIVTDGYTLVNFDLGFEQRLFGRATRIDLGLRNIMNTRYRDFLSRYKEFALDPGRNIILRISTNR
ncbi:MAG TPA: TonB-dependent receptor [Gemmatimonadaceae bacterium]|nr:TonB-dependent receptor [Gemmatimonadaceae bacterium]